MNLKEVRIQFRNHAYVGVVNGMLYFKGESATKYVGVKKLSFVQMSS
jgi:hypothetical protein